MANNFPDAEGPGVADDFNTEQYDSEENSFIISNQRYLIKEQEKSLIVSDGSSIQEKRLPPLQQQHPLHIQQHNWEIDLIEEVRSYECLWNTKCRAFKETPKKAEAWRRISAKLNLGGWCL